jgi:hypothetical protein
MRDGTAISIAPASGVRSHRSVPTTLLMIIKATRADNRWRLSAAVTSALLTRDVREVAPHKTPRARSLTMAKPP